MPLSLTPAIKTSLLTTSLRALKSERGLNWTTADLEVNAVIYDDLTGVSRLVVDAEHTASGLVIRIYMYMSNEPISHPLQNEAYTLNNNADEMLIHQIGTTVSEFRIIWGYLRANDMLGPAPTEPEWEACDFAEAVLERTTVLAGVPAVGGIRSLLLDYNSGMLLVNRGNPSTPTALILQADRTSWAVNMLTLEFNTETLEYDTSEWIPTMSSYSAATGCVSGDHIFVRGEAPNVIRKIAISDLTTYTESSSLPGDIQALRTAPDGTVWVAASSGSNIVLYSVNPSTLDLAQLSTESALAGTVLTDMLVTDTDVFVATAVMFYRVTKAAGVVLTPLSAHVDNSTGYTGSSFARKITRLESGLLFITVVSLDGNSAYWMTYNPVEGTTTTPLFLATPMSLLDRFVEIAPNIVHAMYQLDPSGLMCVSVNTTITSGMSWSLISYNGGSVYTGTKAQAAQAFDGNIYLPTNFDDHIPRILPCADQQQLSPARVAALMSPYRNNF
jgi:hypothetical protein